MSFDIFVTTLTDDKNDLFERSIVERAFSALSSDQTEENWSLHTADGELTSADLSIDEGPRIPYFAVGRPPFIPEFWQAIFEVLQQTRTAIWWPTTGHPNYCVANPDLMAHFPDEVIAQSGEPTFVSSGAEIEAAIIASGK